MQDGSGANTEDSAADDAWLDPGLITWFALLTPDERLAWLEDFVAGVLELRALNGIVDALVIEDDEA